MRSWSVERRAIGEASSTTKASLGTPAPVTAAARAERSVPPKRKRLFPSSTSENTAPGTDRAAVQEVPCEAGHRARYLIRIGSFLLRELQRAGRGHRNTRVDGLGRGDPILRAGPQNEHDQ